jgi:hypothetical protein
MNKFLPLLVFVLIFNFSDVFGQCVKKKDAFSNEIVASFEWKARGVRTLYFESTQGKSIFQFRAAEMAAIEYTIPKGSEVLIKLENEDIINLLTNVETKSAVSSMTISDSDNITFSTYFLTMDVSQDQLRKLSASKITDMRIPDLHGSSRSYDSKELRNKFQRSVMEGAKCILE